MISRRRLLRRLRSSSDGFLEKFGLQQLQQLKDFLLSCGEGCRRNLRVARLVSVQHPRRPPEFRFLAGPRT